MKSENFNKQDDITVVNESVKKRGRGGTNNFPSTVDDENPDDIRQALAECMRWYKRGSDKAVTEDEVKSRTIEFFENCYKNGERPTVEKYALALGHSRQMLWKMENKGDRVGDVIKQAKEFLASFDANLVASGKMNPVPYIFRAKNYYGLRDQQDLVIAPSSPLDSTVSAQDVATKYAELPED